MLIYQTRILFLLPMTIPRCPSSELWALSKVLNHLMFFVSCSVTYYLTCLLKFFQNKWACLLKKNSGSWSVFHLKIFWKFIIVYVFHSKVKFIISTSHQILFLLLSNIVVSFCVHFLSFIAQEQFEISCSPLQCILPGFALILNSDSPGQVTSVHSSLPHITSSNQNLHQALPV